MKNNAERASSLPLTGTGGITHRDNTGKSDIRSSHAVETFFLSGNPMNMNIHIIPGKNTQNLVSTLSPKKASPGTFF